MDDEGNQPAGDGNATGHGRPRPSLTSMLAVGGGLLVAAGLFFLLGEVDGFDQRGVALAISLLFLVLGVALSTINRSNRSNRSASAGVVISALAVVPLTVYLFANADVFGQFNGSDVQGNPWDGLRGIVTLMLATAAVLWLLGYVLGPGRRFGFYLGAALIAIWLIPIATIQISAYEDLFNSFETSSPFTPGPFDSSIDSGSNFGSDLNSEFDAGSDSGFSIEEPTFPDPSTKLGVISLGFGLVYLAFAALRDRRGDPRMATAALVPAIIILLYALNLLVLHTGWVGIGLLGIGVGAAILTVGLRGGRRASSWIGLAVATIGFGWLVARWLQDSPRAIGAVLTVIGVAIAVGVGISDRRPPAGDGAPPVEPEPDPFGSPAPVTEPFASPFGAPPDSPVFTPPTAPPAGPPSDASPWATPF